MSDNKNSHSGVEQQRTAEFPAGTLEQKIFEELDGYVSTNCMMEVVIALKHLFASQFRASTGLKGWQTEKPAKGKQCVFVSASWHGGYWHFAVWELKYIEFDGEWYWGLLDAEDGNEWGNYEDLKADKYLILSPVEETESTPSPSLADTQYISQLKQNNESLPKELTAQEQRIGELERALWKCLDHLPTPEALPERTPTEIGTAVKNAYKLLMKEPTAQVSDTRDGDSKANPDQQKPDLAEQLRAMNPYEEIFGALKSDEINRHKHNGWNQACNKLNEIINDKK